MTLAKSSIKRVWDGYLSIPVEVWGLMFIAWPWGMVAAGWLNVFWAGVGTVLVWALVAYWRTQE